MWKTIQTTDQPHISVYIWVEYFYQNQFNGAACGGDLCFGTGGSNNVQGAIPERMRITHDGKVGIGTEFARREIRSEWLDWT